MCCLPISSNKTRDIPSLVTTHFSINQSPSNDLALEAALLDAGDLSVFVYVWDKPVLVLGSGQQLDGIDVEVCRAEGIDILKRSTGGTGVLHQSTLNVALILPFTHPWASNIVELYEKFTAPLMAVLKDRGIPLVKISSDDSRPKPKRTPICFESHTEDTLLYGGKKVFGSSQRRRRQGALIHGTFFLGLDVPQQARVYRASEDRINGIMGALPNFLDPSELGAAILARFVAHLSEKGQG